MGLDGSPLAAATEALTAIVQVGAMLARGQDGQLYEVLTNASGQLETVTGLPVSGVFDAVTNIIGAPGGSMDAAGNMLATLIVDKGAEIVDQYT